MNYWLYFAIVIALVVVLNILTGVHARLKPPKYKRKPEFSWDSLDDNESHERN